MKRKESGRRYLFSSESVGIGHPDKVADQISDAVLDAYLAKDKKAKVACETFVTTNTVIIGGEVNSSAKVDVVDVAKRVIEDIGYTDSSMNFDAYSCKYVVLLHEQSPDIARGVEKEKEIGAGDQGIMFGYATDETPALMPAPIYVAHRIMETVWKILQKKEKMEYLYPDGKCQVTMLYEDGTPLCIKTFLISLNHREFHHSDDVMLRQIREDVKNYLIPLAIEEYFPEIKKFFSGEYELLVNPTGRFVLGGPHADTGLTGRKIIVDTYGGACPHGGGAFSGKDPTKVDRSGAYMARYIAKNIVAAGLASRVVVHISYGIGISKPLSVMIDTCDTLSPEFYGVTEADIEKCVIELFDLTPGGIIENLKLRAPIYRATSVFGHFGRDPYQARTDGISTDEAIEFFTWEKTDRVSTIKRYFGIKEEVS